MKPANQNKNNDQSLEAIPVSFLFFSKGQTAARKGLGEILTRGVNFLAITGPLGSGKTTLLNQLTQHLTRNVTLARIIEYKNSSEDILYDVLIAFGQAPGDLNHSELLKALFNFLLEQHSQNNKPVLIVDNAETLNHDALMSFHSLSDLRSEGNILLRVVLAGSSDLLQNSNQPSFVPSIFPIPVIQIEPFTEDETYRYLNKNYRVANTSKQVTFSKRAAKLIHSYCRGNPLATNKLSGWALRLAKWKNRKRVTYYFANKAVKTPVWARFSEQFPPVHTKNEGIATSSTSQQLPKVIIFKCNQRVAEHDLGKKLVLLGRARGSTVVLRRPSVSRRHACLTILNNQVWIKNLSHTNNTFVNAKPIENHPLRDGDIIRIGDFLVFFLYEGTAVTAVVPGNMESIPETSKKKGAESTGSVETILDVDSGVGPKAPEVTVVPEENISVEPSRTRKKRSLSITERRNRREQKRTRRWLLTAAAGVVALLGPMLAVMFFLEPGNIGPTIEVPAKMDTLSSTQTPMNKIQRVENDSELLAVEKTSESIEELEVDTSLANPSNMELEPSVVNNHLQNIIIEAGKHLQRDEISQSLNLIIEGVRLDPENKDLLQLQVQTMARLVKKEQEWNTTTNQAEKP